MLERLHLRDADLEDVDLCLADPDLVRPVALQSGSPGGLRFERRMPRGSLILIARQEGEMLIVITVYWNRPHERPRRGRRS